MDVIVHQIQSNQLSFMSTIKQEEHGTNNKEMTDDTRGSEHRRGSSSSRKGIHSSGRTSRSNTVAKEPSSSLGLQRNWSSCISCNGNGYQDRTDVTLCIGNGTTGVRVLIMSQKNAKDNKTIEIRSSLPFSPSLPISSKGKTEGNETTSTTTATTSKKKGKRKTKMKRKSMSNKRKPYSGDVTSSANGKQKISNICYR